MEKDKPLPLNCVNVSVLGPTVTHSSLQSVK